MAPSCIVMVQRALAHVKVAEAHRCQLGRQSGKTATMPTTARAKRPLTVACEANIA